jgi:hypothetical protein
MNSVEANVFVVGDFFHWERDRYGNLMVARNEDTGEIA